MLYIGLTGNRYSGKDRICKLFKQIHVPVFDADIVLKFNLHYNYELINKLHDKIGDFYFEFDKINLNRIFKDDKFDMVIKHFEKDIFEAYNRFNLKNSKSVYTIFKSSILFEAEWDKKLDSTITVFAPSNVRTSRCKFDTTLTLSEIYQFAKSEMSDLDKNNKSKYVIHNYEPHDVLSAVSKIDNRIVDMFLHNSMVENCEN